MDCQRNTMDNPEVKFNLPWVLDSYYQWSPFKSLVQTSYMVAILAFEWNIDKKLQK